MNLSMLKNPLLTKLGVPLAFIFLTMAISIYFLTQRVSYLSEQLRLKEDMVKSLQESLLECTSDSVDRVKLCTEYKSTLEQINANHIELSEEYLKLSKSSRDLSNFTLFTEKDCKDIGDISPPENTPDNGDENNEIVEVIRRGQRDASISVLCKKGVLRNPELCGD